MEQASRAQEVPKWVEEDPDDPAEDEHTDHRGNLYGRIHVWIHPEWKEELTPPQRRSVCVLVVRTYGSGTAASCK